ncbi:E3 ubiquitin-protein ligase UBR5-like isoform X2 [Gordionus sp. m RMFG-2023]|uniref:E3 ubiquitin-protein ligase UBR5-like isoform X2 n=1 Tax=Gordionus sp. m RMFG-2023 TaxID=3053472 RepID=UPI0031FDBF73
MSIICSTLYSSNITPEKIFERIKDAAQKISTNNYQTPISFLQLGDLKIKKCLVDKHYLAFLTEDGYICRIEYNIKAEKIENTPQPTKKLPKEFNDNKNTNLGGSKTSALSSYSSIFLNQNSTTALTKSRIRRTIPTTFRNRSGNFLLTHRTLIPASSVPEEFITQAQAVLQGKSRAVIVRELQRTNLDINMAVNNLLSREEEEEEEEEEDEGEGEEDDPDGGDDLTTADDSYDQDAPRADDVIRYDVDNNYIMDGDYDNHHTRRSYFPFARRSNPPSASRNGTTHAPVTLTPNPTATPVSDDLVALLDGVGSSALARLTSFNLDQNNHRSTGLDTDANISGNNNQANGKIAIKKRKREEIVNNLDDNADDVGEGNINARIRDNFNGVDTTVNASGIATGTGSSGTTTSGRSSNWLYYTRQLPSTGDRDERRTSVSTITKERNKFNDSTFKINLDDMNYKISSARNKNHNAVSANSSHGNTTKTVNNNSAISDTNYSLSISGNLNYWMDNENTLIKFSDMSATESELLGVSVDCKLHQWLWDAKSPFYLQLEDKTQIFHPRTVELGLLNQNIIMISSSKIRVSIIIETDKIATWFDPTIASVAKKFEHPATFFPELKNEVIKSMDVCDYYTMVLTDSGKLFWWGFMPPKLRTKLSEKPSFSHSSSLPTPLLSNPAPPFPATFTPTAPTIMPHALNSASSSHHTASHISAGSLVTFKARPTLPAGALVLSCDSPSGKPALAILQQNVQNNFTQNSQNTNNYNYKGRNTSAEIGEGQEDDKKNLEEKRDRDVGEKWVRQALVKVVTVDEYMELQAKRLLANTNSNFDEEVHSTPTDNVIDASMPIKRKKYSERSTLDNYQLVENSKRNSGKLELWNVDEMIVLEDNYESVVGKVIKVDEAYAIVQNLGYKSSDFHDDLSSILRNCKVLKKDDLIPISSNSHHNHMKRSDCFIKNPRRFNLPNNYDIVSFSIDPIKIQALAKHNITGKLHFLKGHFGCSNKLDVEKETPFLASKFCGDKLSAQIYTTKTDKCNLTLIRDGNSALCPFSISGNDFTQECQPMNSLPLQCLHLVRVPLPNLITTNTYNSSVSNTSIGNSCMTSSSSSSTSIPISSSSSASSNLNSEINNNTNNYKSSSSNTNHQALIILMCFEPSQLLLPLLRCDYTGVLGAINALDDNTLEMGLKPIINLQNKANISDEDVEQGILSVIESTKSTRIQIIPDNEYSDCNSNPLHLLADLCKPTTAKDESVFKGETTSRISNRLSNSLERLTRMGDAMDSILNAMSSCSSLATTSSNSLISRKNIRDLMRKATNLAKQLRDNNTALTNSVTTTTNSTSLLSNAITNTNINTPSSIPNVNTFVTGQDIGPLERDEFLEMPILTWPATSDTTSASNNVVISKPPITYNNTKEGTEKIDKIEQEKLDADFINRFIAKNPVSVHLTPQVREIEATRILEYMCDKCKALDDRLYILMSQTDLLGYTPFMRAVKNRAYYAAMIMFDCAKRLALDNIKFPCYEKQRDALESMIFPPGSEPGKNPFHTLCSNDTCSFTWTGKQHINQDIFECKTCGLVGSLCCCTECASVCHQGHVVAFKRSSPTAYCDCWEKCPCKALLPGSQFYRWELLNKMLSVVTKETGIANEGKSKKIDSNIVKDEKMEIQGDDEYCGKTNIAKDEETGIKRGDNDSHHINTLENSEGKMLLDGLYNLPNYKGEHILLYLAQTVGRQVLEQRQYRPSSITTNTHSSSNHNPTTTSGAKEINANNLNTLTDTSLLYEDYYYFSGRYDKIDKKGRENGSSSNGTTSRDKTNTAYTTDNLLSMVTENTSFNRNSSQMPVHDLEPPRFSRRALERLLGDWGCLRNCLNQEVDPSSTSSYAHKVDETGQFYMSTQSGSAKLDRFVHCLIVRCNIEMLETLLNTLIREIQNDKIQGRKADARRVAARFVRSVIRIFVVFNMEMAPGKAKRRIFSTLGYSLPLTKCKRAFLALIDISLEELAETANSLIIPVRMGALKPTTPFTLVSSNVEAVQGCEDLFTSEPLSSLLNYPPSSTSIFTSSIPPDFIDNINPIANNLNDAYEEPHDNNPRVDRNRLSNRSNYSRRWFSRNNRRGLNLNNAASQGEEEMEEDTMEPDALTRISTTYDDEGLVSRINEASRYPNNTAVRMDRLIDDDPDALHDNCYIDEEESTANEEEDLIINEIVGEDNEDMTRNEHDRAEGAHITVPISERSNAYGNIVDNIEEAPSNIEEDGYYFYFEDGIRDENQDLTSPLIPISIQEPINNIYNNINPVSTSNQLRFESQADSNNATDVQNAQNQSDNFRDIALELIEDVLADREDTSMVTTVLGTSEIPVTSSTRNQTTTLDRPGILSRRRHAQGNYLGFAASNAPRQDNYHNINFNSNNLFYTSNNNYPFNNSLALTRQSHGQSISQTPTNMQWVIQNSQPQNYYQRNLAPNVSITNPGMVYIDSMGIRRNISSANPPTNSVLPNNNVTNNPNITSDIPLPSNLTNSQLAKTASVSNTMKNLARAYGIVVRQINESLVVLDDYRNKAPGLPRILTLSRKDVNHVKKHVDLILRPTWDWLFCVMDSLESQLQFGAALNAATHSYIGNNNNNPSNSVQNLNQGFSSSNPLPSTDPRVSKNNGSRPTINTLANDFAMKDFLTYTLSLMRAQSHEHFDNLPSLDILSYRHVAYVFDAFVGYLRCPVWRRKGKGGRKNKKRDKRSQNRIGLSNFWTTENEEEVSTANEDQSSNKNKKDSSLTMSSKSDVKVTFDDSNRQGTSANHDDATLQPEPKFSSSEDDEGKEDKNTKGQATAQKMGASTREVKRKDGKQKKSRGKNKLKRFYYFSSSNSKNADGPLVETSYDSENARDQDNIATTDNNNNYEYFDDDEEEENANIYEDDYRHNAWGEEGDEEFDDEDEEELDDSMEDDDDEQKESGKRKGYESWGDSSGENSQDNFFDYSSSPSPSTSARSYSFSTSSRSLNENTSDSSSSASALPRATKRKKKVKISKIVKTGSKYKPNTKKAKFDTGKNEEQEETNKNKITKAGETACSSYMEFKKDSNEIDIDLFESSNILKGKEDKGDRKNKKFEPLNDDRWKKSSANNENKKNKNKRHNHSHAWNNRRGIKPFFRRTESTLHLGYPAPHPFTTPILESLPLAQEPHLLKPEARKEDMFRICRSDGLCLKVKRNYAKSGIKYTRNSRFSISMSSSAHKESIWKHQANQSQSHKSTISQIKPDCILRRWNTCLDMFGRMFVEDVGLEPGSVFVEMGGFPIKETKFRADMEKLRNSQAKDLTLEVERERETLLKQTIKQLNHFYSRRSNNCSGPPLAVHKVKVTFKDEPGEGSGVARSFYSALASAFASSDILPNLDGCLPGTLKSLQFNIWNRIKSKDQKQRSLLTPTSQVTTTTTSPLSCFKVTLSASAQPFYPKAQRAAGVNNANLSNNEESSTGLTSNQALLGERLYLKIRDINSEFANQITGMILELAPAVILFLLASEENLRVRVNEAYSLLITGDKGKTIIGDEGTSKSQESARGTTNDAPPSTVDASSLAQLFHQPGKIGFYSPMPVKNNSERASAFRNVGRIIGLCLLQNEVFSLQFNRHVLKSIMGKPLSWHDFAFYDPVMYESLRCLLKMAIPFTTSTHDKTPLQSTSAVDNKETYQPNNRYTTIPDIQESEQFFKHLDLTFSLEETLADNQNHATITVDLIPGGSNLPVTPYNVQEYVEAYVRYKMEGAIDKALENIKLGVFDVLPKNAFDGLTPEDLRLLLNGIGEFKIETLMSYTTFNDECGASQDKIIYFRKWFWSILDKMTSAEKQDLLYFWMSTSCLPSSKDGFQPTPSVTIRPPDDTHLPTANTCISRLYIPLYSSKTIFRNKLLLAIKTKTFGFV